MSWTAKRSSAARPASRKRGMKKQYYVWFLILSIIAVLALIGYQFALNASVCQQTGSPIFGFQCP